MNILFRLSKANKLYKINKEPLVKIKFNLEDRNLIDLLEDYNAGYFGKGNLGFDWLFYELSREGYMVKRLKENEYIIN
ncbi:hypothetical protein [Bacillus coreaensis]